jgi:aminocarboxymuconate-semialdehyde decarboxylase
MSPYYVSVALFPIEIAMAAASLIMAGVPERFPGLRIAFSHGGGGFSAMLGRLDQGWSCVPALSEKLRARPSEIARKLFFDSNVYDPAELHFLAVDAAPGRVFAGSDYPYKIMERDLASLIEAAGLDSQRNAEVRSLAALAFLGEGSEAR